MELKVYRKDLDYSYALGAFPTMELINSRCEEVIKVLIHSTFDNKEVIDEIKKKISEDKISYNDKLIEKLSDKGNVYVIGVFKKYIDKLEEDADHVVLWRPSNMGNLGTIMRSSLGFGIKNIAIIENGPDYFDPKVVRASMGSIFNEKVEFFNSLEEYTDKYPNHKQYKFMLQANKSLRDELFDSKRCSLVFGNEATGIDRKYLDDNALIIRHSNEIDSLNITNAVSIALYEYHEKKSGN